MLDASGSIIGNTGPNSLKHSRQTFASVPFTIDNQTRRTNEYGVPADAVDFRTTLLGTSELSVATLVFLHHGVITPTANESWAVAGGTIKFNVQFSSWPFCSGESGNPCQGATGEFLELGMEIKGMTDNALPSGEKRYTLATNAATGNNITLELSDEVNVDGTWVRMPSGYPRVEMQGSKQLFKFRFPRFNGAALYDPVINGVGSPAPPAPPPPPVLPPPSAPPAVPSPAASLAPSPPSTAPPSAVAVMPSPPSAAVAVSPPASPPLSQLVGLPPGTPPTTPTIEMSFAAAGSVDDFGETEKAAIQAVVADAAGVATAAVTVTIAPASVRITATVSAPDADTAASVAGSLSAAFSDAAATTAQLQAVIPGIVIESAPAMVTHTVVSQNPLPVPEPIQAEDGVSMVLVAIGAGCGLIVLLLLVFFYCMRSRKLKQTEHLRLTTPPQVTGSV